MGTVTSTYEVVAKPDMSRDTWLNERRKGIGGSDVVAIAGLNKDRSRYVTWLDKRGELNLPDETSEAAELGIDLEEFVAWKFEQRTGHKVFPTPGTIRHPKYQWMLVTPDRLVCDLRHTHSSTCVPTALLECKTTAGKKARDWDHEELPYAAALQVHHGLEVVDMTKAYVAGLVGDFGGHRFVIVEVDRDADLIAMLLELEAEFWREVVENDPPPVDGMESTKSVLNKLYDVQPETQVELPEIALDVIQERELAAKEEKEAKARKTECENVIKAWMQGSEVGLVAGHPVLTWKESPRAGYTVEPTTTRSLRFKKASK